MSLTKLPVVSVIPGTPAVAARPYSRDCTPPVSNAGGGTVSGAHGAVVSTYTQAVAQQSCYSCAPTIVLEVCTVYADGYTECQIQNAAEGGTQIG